MKLREYGAEATILSDKTLIKTGLAAAIVTAVFAIGVFKAAEWSRSKATGPAAASHIAPDAASPDRAASATKVIPQIAIGSFDGGTSKYSTILELVNTGSSDASVAASFYKEDGTLLPVPMMASLKNETLFTGETPSLTIPAGQVLVVSGGTTGATTPPSGLIGWGKLTTTGNVSVSTYFELRSGKTGALASRIGVAASPPDLSRFLIPRVRTKSGLDVAFAIVNTGSEPAAITATLRNANGAIVATRSIKMNPRTHLAMFAHAFFSLPVETGDRDYQYIVFNSNSRSFSAIALAYEPGAQTSFPVDPLN